MRNEVGAIDVCVGTVGWHLKSWSGLWLITNQPCDDFTSQGPHLLVYRMRGVGPALPPTGLEGPMLCSINGNMLSQHQAM